MNFLKKLSPFVTMVLILGCSQSKKTLENKPITFANYLKTLDNIPLPFEHSCSGPNLPELSTHFDSAGFDKFKDPNCARPLGILFNDKSNVVLVDISLADYCLAPILVSFNHKGKKLDVLSLYSHSFQDTASSSMPYFEINKNKEILVVDTNKKWKLDTATNKIPGSEIITIKRTKYFISKNGKFIEKN